MDPLSDAAFEDLEAMTPDAGDKSLRVRFFLESMKDEVLSSGGEVAEKDRRVVIAKEKGIEVEPVLNDDGRPIRGRVRIVGAGRPIYVSEEMIEIRTPGNKDNVIVQRVRKMEPDPRERFPAQYAKFKRGDEQQHVGTLLRKWGILDEGEALTYEAIGIFTVEQLAGMTDAACQEYRGSSADRQKARDWLDTVKGNAPAAAARAEAQKLRDEVRALRDELQSMKGASVTPAKPARRGRKEPTA
jgi:hypothetical protein